MSKINRERVLLGGLAEAILATLVGGWIYKE
jgi:hypothetical protein